jgi:hypothetical protein
MNLPRSASLALATAILLAIPVSASAQYSPDASLDLGVGYGAIALGQSTLSGTRQLDAKGKGSDELSPTMQRYCARWPDETTCRMHRARKAQRHEAAAAPSPERMGAMMAQVRPEYERRLRRDGKASADRWLSQTARALGEQHGRAAHRRR